MADCLSCLRTIQHLKKGYPPVCGDCWQQMTPAERCARWEAHDTFIFLSSLQGQTDALEVLMGKLDKTEQALVLAARASNSINKTLSEYAENGDRDGWYESMLKKRRQN